MNRITFCGGESTGSVADRKIESGKSESTGGVAVSTARHESTGGVAARIQHNEPQLRLRTLERDTVSFHGVKDRESGSSALGTISGVAFTAAAAVAGLGLAGKYHAADKISNSQVRDFVTRYGTDPCYKFCKNVKEKSIEYYNKAKNFVSGKGN